MAEKYIHYATEAGVARILFNRAEKFNSINRAMAMQLQDALNQAAGDHEVRAILLCAEGKAFCAGQDLGESIDPSDTGIQKMVTEQYNPIIMLLRSIEKPIVCAVNGVAAGAGANIALACDIVLAGASAAFIQAFSKIGLIPDSGGTFILPRLIGWQRASALMMTGDKVSAPQALEMGMVYKVVADESLLAEAGAFAERLAQMPTKGLGLTKRLLNESVNNSLDMQLMREAVVQAEAGGTADFAEGVKAFMEKRKPAFRGA